MESNLNKLVSLNVAGRDWNDVQLSFFRQTGADILCLQEIYKDDFQILKKTLNMKGVFTPTLIKASNRKSDATKKPPLGIAILTKFPIVEKDVISYAEKDVSIDRDNDIKMTSIRDIIVVGIITPTKKIINLGTVHFTWSPDGKATEIQKIHIKSLINKASHYSDLILCGDFNAPRGGEIFSLIAGNYRDNIPSQYKTSIDRKKHRSGNLNLMVDGLFTSKNNSRVSNVYLEDGVSDHLAIVAELQ